MYTILISEQALCPATLIALYASRYLQGENGTGLAVRSRLRIPFRRMPVNVVVSGPVSMEAAQRFEVSWAAGADRERRTFAGELYVGAGMAPDSGSIVLTGSYMHARRSGNREAGAGRPRALAVGRALLRTLRIAIENAHGIDYPHADAIAYAWRHMN